MDRCGLKVRALMWAGVALGGLICARANAAEDEAPIGDGRFTVAVIPDTQFYLDHHHQRAEGFPFDAHALFLQQMHYVATHLAGRGGDIAFVTALGDVWQSRIGLGDYVRPGSGAAQTPPARAMRVAVEPKVAALEVPVARLGYDFIAGRVPFSVVPGNHDYDWSWQGGGQIRVGGLVNFESVFSPRSRFFKGQSWYVGAHAHGADSAQVFSAGGYRFLHIGLEYDPSEDSLRWARSILQRYHGLPTVLTTHRFLDPSGARPSDAHADTRGEDADYNSPQRVWEALIAQYDQIFLVLSGHYKAQAFRHDPNRFGHEVYQIMSDYQNRHQTAKEAGVQSEGSGEAGIGDGWLRLMQFDLRGTTPAIHVRTYSTYYRTFSTDTPNYVAWYKAAEMPQASDREFLDSDDFTVALSDFRARFGEGCQRAPADAHACSGAHVR